jgi:hypothetical protein
LPPLALLYVGPYEVLERADKNFRLAVGGREETVSIDCLKPHLGVGSFSAALPAARGRPPTSAPMVVQPQHPPAAATRGGIVAVYRTNGVIIFIDYCTAPRDIQKGGRRRKRHSTSTCE